MWNDYQWLLIGGLWIIAFVIGYIGAKKQLAALGETRSPLDPIYRTLQLFIMDDSMIVSGPVLPWELELARFMAPIVAMYTAVTALVTIFREELQIFCLRFMNNHVVICGLGRKGLLLAKGFQERGDRVVVIEQDPNNVLLGQCKERGVTVVIGDARDPELLRKVRVNTARYVVAACADDGVNVEVAVYCHELVGDRKGRVLTCFVHIVNPQLCNLLREREIMTQKVDSFRLEFFNIYDNGARALLKVYPAFDETAAAQSPLPHILVVGLGRMGESLVVHLGRQWRTIHVNTGERLPITIIDRAVDEKIRSFSLRHPRLEKVCELIPQQMDICSAEFERAQFLFNAQGQPDVTAAYICIDNDSLGLASGLSLFQHLRANRVPIVVRMLHDAGLATLLRLEGSIGGVDDIHVFGLLDQTCTLELLLGGTHDILARAIHEEYVRSQTDLGETVESNPSMVAWEALPEGLKESNRRQADHIGIKLRAVGCGIAPFTDWDAEDFKFTPEEIELTAEMEHERWNEERLRGGWQYASGPKDIEHKTSPHIVPWTELSEDIRERDKNTMRKLPSVLAKAGFQIYRIK